MHQRGWFAFPKNRVCLVAAAVPPVLSTTSNYAPAPSSMLTGERTRCIPTVCFFLCGGRFVQLCLVKPVLVLGREGRR